jgi:hypothetical protein
MYSVTVLDTVGWVLLAFAALGAVIFVRKYRLRLRTLPGYLVLFPFAFYWFVLYAGVNTESLPEFGQHAYYNVRFGLLMVPAVAMLCAVVVGAARGWRGRWRRRAVVAVALVAIVGSAVVGFAQTPLAVREARTDPLFHSGVDERQSAWLSSHYHGGAVLIEYVNDASLMFYLLTKHHFADRSFITDANGQQFKAALAHPEANVTWIVMNTDERTYDSRILKTLRPRTDWRRFFALRATFVTPYGVTTMFERLVA